MPTKLGGAYYRPTLYGMTSHGHAPRGADHWTAAMTHCTQGHPYSGDNLIMYRGRRYCLACRRAKCRSDYKKRDRLKPGERRALIEAQKKTAD